MANTISFQNQQLFDPIAIQKSLEYQVNGLTYVSNNNSIHPRDEAGNIVLHENSDTNPLLIIEPVKQNFFNNSVIQVLDTAFQYYTFPVYTDENTISDLNTNVDLNFIDTISTRYTIPYQEYPEGFPNQYRALNTKYPDTWFNDTVSTAGYNILPFTGTNQLKKYSYTVTSDTIDIIKNSNKTIKFYIQLQTAVYATGSNSTFKNTMFQLRLSRSNPDINLYRNTDLAELFTQNAGNYNQGNYPLMFVEYVLNPNDLYNYDTFFVEAMSDYRSFYLGDNTVWNIDLIDDPLEYGIVSISNKTTLHINGVTIIDGREY